MKRKEIATASVIFSFLDYGTQKKSLKAFLNELGKIKKSSKKSASSVGPPLKKAFLFKKIYHPIRISWILRINIKGGLPIANS